MMEVKLQNKDMALEAKYESDKMKGRKPSVP
jgi:hypothetical protein